MSDTTRHSSVPIEALVTEYADSAASHGRLVENGRPEEANVHAENVADIYRELRRRGSAAQHALLPLLKSPDTNVRVWASAHALEFDPAEGEQTLSELAALPGIVAFNAKMTLDVWRRGELSFP